MRELRFRAWNVEFGYMVDSRRSIATIMMRYLLEYPAPGGLNASGQHYNMATVTQDDYIINQFTGVHDSYGNPIYEGDVVEDRYTTRGVVMWSREACGFFVDSGSRNEPLRLLSRWYRVIGNIYEFPELLDGATHNETVH